MFARVSRARPPAVQHSPAPARPPPVQTPVPSASPVRTHSLAALVIQRRIMGFDAIKDRSAISQLWVDAYVADVLDPHAHLYLEDIVRYLDTNNPGVRDDVHFDNGPGDHWNVDFGQEPNKVHVVTKSDGSCGVHAVHAVLHRDASAAKPVGYAAPNDFITQVRTWIQSTLTDVNEIKARIYDRIDQEDAVANAGFGAILTGMLQPVEQAAHLAAMPVTPTSLDRDVRSSGEQDEYEEDLSAYNEVDAEFSNDDLMSDETSELNEDASRPDEDEQQNEQDSEQGTSGTEPSEPELSEYEESPGYLSEPEFKKFGAREKKPGRRKKLDVRDAYRVRAKGKGFPINTSSGLRSLVDAAETGQPAANTHLLYKHKDDKSYTFLQQNTATGTRVAAGRYKPKGNVPGANRINVSASSVRGAYKGLRNVHTEMHLLYIRTGGDATQIPNCLNGYTVVVDKPTCADCIEFVRSAKPDELRDNSDGIDAGGRATFKNWTNPFDRTRRNTGKRKRL